MESNPIWAGIIPKQKRSNSGGPELLFFYTGWVGQQIWFLASANKISIKACKAFQM